MGQIITIKTAELSVSKNRGSIITGSIGSCIVIALYDSKAQVGGLAHAMLPHKRDFDIDADTPPAKYVDQAIDNLIREIIKIGGSKENLVAKLVGGASMFKQVTNVQHGIGIQNITSARNYLTGLGILIESEDTGGSSGKIVEFDLATGMVSVNTKL